MRALRLIPPGHRALIGVTLALVALLTAAYWDYTQDDVFITFAYSRHIASGEGFVFNPGERVQGTTTPLYALLMAGVYALTPDLLHAGNLLSGLFALATVALLVSALRPALSRLGTGALAITLAVSPLIYVSFGMETLLYSAILAGAFWLWARGRRAASLLAAAALTWTRADGLVLAATLGLLAAGDALGDLRAGRGDSRRSLATVTRLALVYLGGIAPWFLFAWAYFSAPLPQTFSAKEELFQGVKFWEDGVGWWRAFYGNNPLSLLAIPLITLGVWRAGRSPDLRPLVLWPALYFTGYLALNVTAFWYYTPLLVALIALAALGGDWLARRLVRAGWRQPLVAGMAGLLVLVSAALAAVRAWEYRAPPPRMATYRLVGEWIAAHTAPDATLLVKDLGIVGYYAQRHTRDSFGLIVPDLHVVSDAYAAARYKTDLVVTTQYWEMQRLVAGGWFRAHYAPLAQFSTPGDAEFSPMAVFHRRLDLAPPAALPQGFDLPLTCTVTLGPGAALPAETRARLRDESGAVIGEAAHSFLWGQYPAPRALGRETLVEQIALPLDVPPGRYTWELACGEQTLSGPVEVEPVTRAPGYTPLSAPVTWGAFAQLRGVALPHGAETWAGGSLAAVLHWEALGAAEQDYSVFLHLADSAGRVWAQTDGPPRNGSRPPSGWTSGEIIVDVRQIMLPPDLSPGEYMLIAGWYDWQSGARVPLPGQPDDALILPIRVTNHWPGGSGLP